MLKLQLEGNKGRNPSNNCRLFEEILTINPNHFLTELVRWSPNKLKIYAMNEGYKSEKHRPYRIIKGTHYGVPEREFKTHKERMDYLSSYAKKAQEIYELYKNNPEEIKDEEEKIMFTQYCLYMSYESELILVEIFRALINKAATIAKLIETLEKEGGTKEEINSLRIRFALAKLEVQEMIDRLGPLLEFAHRRILRQEEIYKHRFYRLSKEEARLKVLAEEPIGDVSTAQKIFKKKWAEKGVKGEEETAIQRDLIKIAQARDYLRLEEDLPTLLQDEKVLAELKKLSEATGEDLISFAERLIREREEGPKEYRKKSEIIQRLQEIQEELDRLWEEPLTRYFVYQDYLERLIFQDQMGEPVLEIPSVTRLMNELAAWERRHTETPIGGVLIGPPGTGKSLVIEYYLKTHPEHRKKGPPVIIDMSQETTEFVLLGGEAIEITDRFTVLNAIYQIFQKQEEIETRIKRPDISTAEKEELEVELEWLDQHIEDILHVLLGQYVEFRRELVSDDEIERYSQELGEDLVRRKRLTPEQKQKLTKKIKSAISKWQAMELGKIMYGNGWRDGIILKALKEGRDIIINEYNNFRLPPDALRQLFQTAYGGKWFFAGTGEEITVMSRIYLTANAGSSAEKFFYDTAQLTAAFESRLPPPIVVELPPTEEELLIIQAKLSDTNKRLLCDKELERKLQATGALEDYEFILKFGEAELIVYLFEEILPKLRALSAKAPKEIPSLDLRHINRFCRDLVNPFTRERTRMSVEEAFVRNFLKPFLSNPTAFEILVNEGIVQEMYKKGLLHNNDKETRSLLIEVFAKEEGYDLSAVSKEGRINILTKIEEKLQKIDKELIENLEKIEGEEKWKGLLKRAGEERRIFISNPYLKVSFQKMFSREFSRPESRSF